MPLGETPLPDSHTALQGFLTVLLCFKLLLMTIFKMTNLTPDDPKVSLSSALLNKTLSTIFQVTLLKLGLKNNQESKTKITCLAKPFKSLKGASCRCDMHKSRALVNTVLPRLSFWSWAKNISTKSPGNPKHPLSRELSTTRSNDIRWLFSF